MQQILDLQEFRSTVVQRRTVAMTGGTASPLPTPPSVAPDSPYSTAPLPSLRELKRSQGAAPNVHQLAVDSIVAQDASHSPVLAPTRSVTTELDSFLADV